MEINTAIVVAIMASLGIGVIGIVKMLKDLFKLAGLGAKILTLVVSFAATGAYLVQAEMFSVVALIVYGILVFGEASGLYRVIANRN